MNNALLGWILAAAVGLLPRIGSASDTSLNLLRIPAVRYVFDDSADGGHSHAWSRPGPPWVFGLRLDTGCPWPYASGGIRIDTADRQVDLTGFDSIVVEWRASSPGLMRLQMNAFEPGRTDSSTPSTYVPLEGVLPVETGWTRQAFALRDLAVPVWWSQKRGSPPPTVAASLGGIEAINLMSGEAMPLRRSDTIFVRSLRLEAARSGLSMAVILPAAFLVLLLAGAIVLAVRSQRDRPPTTTTPEPQLPNASPPSSVPSRDIQMEPRKDEETRRLLEWVGEHYMRPDISVDLAGREIGLHPRRIPGILREAGHGTFPATVNRVRLEQARRLLRETDRTVSEIASAVGIPNPSHFHRLFKTATGQTPLDWRAHKD